jgi:hypothetical protein
MKPTTGGITREAPTDTRTEAERDRGILYRSMDLQLDPSAEKKTRADGSVDDRIPIALSSEAGVERYDWLEGDYYLEILDHSPGSVDLSYAKDGLPFLLNHDTEEQIGLIEDVIVDADRKLRGMVRFSRAVRAQENQAGHRRRDPEEDLRRLQTVERVRPEGR